MRKSTWGIAYEPLRIAELTGPARQNSSMEQHAVPQDITGFKFKLVGDMTLKQFAELAAGAVLAYLFYASSLPSFFKLPLTIIFALFGIALAFFPVEERPLDTWIINFLRAIYRPTLYVWKKDSFVLAISSGSPRPLPPKSAPPASDEASLGLGLWPKPSPKEPPAPPPAKEASLPPPPPPAPKPALSVEELEKLRQQKIAELEEAKKKLQEATKEAKTEAFQAKVGASVVTVDQLTKMREATLAQKDNARVQEINAEQGELNKLIAQNKTLMTQIEALRSKITTLSGTDITPLESQLTALSAQKDRLSREIASLQEKLASERVAPLTQPQYQQTRPIIAGPGVRVVPRPQGSPPLISLTDRPNIVNGLILDERGAPIDDAIIIIKDKAGNSIRALKTNRIGQFLVSTPLENGTYYLEIERPGYAFDVLEVTLTGQVLTPIEIPARKITVAPSG